MNDSDRRNRQFVQDFSRCSRRIYSFIRTLVPNQADAEELFQETSTTLWEKFESFEPGTDFRAWAFQIAYYKVLNFRQRAARAPALFSDQLLDAVRVDAQEMAEVLETRSHALADCYARLSAADQQLVDRRFVAESSIKRVAADVGRSVDHVYKSLRRIYATLYRCIDRKMAEGDQP